MESLYSTYSRLKCSSRTYFIDYSDAFHNYASCGSSKPSACVESVFYEGLVCDGTKLTTYSCFSHWSGRLNLAKCFFVIQHNPLCYSRSAYPVQRDSTDKCPYFYCGSVPSDFSLQSTYLDVSNILVNGAVCAITNVGCQDEFEFCRVGCPSWPSVPPTPTPISQVDGHDIYVCPGPTPTSCDNKMPGLYCNGNTIYKDSELQVVLGSSLCYSKSFSGGSGGSCVAP